MLGVLFTAVFLSVGGNAFLAGEQDIVLLTAVVQGTSFEFGPIHVNMTAIATSRGVCFGPTPTTNIITQARAEEALSVMCMRYDFKLEGCARKLRRSCARVVVVPLGRGMWMDVHRLER
jgi:hypothetical protein